MSELFQIDGPLVSVIIPTMNNVRLTAQLMASLAQSADGISYEVIIVDNGSTDETISFVKSHTAGQLSGKAQGPNPPSRVALIKNTKVGAIARSWNRGIEQARGRFYLIANNDTIFTPGALMNMVRAFREDRRLGCVLPAQRETEYPKEIVKPTTAKQAIANIQRSFRWAAEKPLASAPLTYIRHHHVLEGGYCFLLSREAFDLVGPFDENFELTSEDWDYFRRVLRFYKMAYCQEAYVLHYGHTTCAALGDDYEIRLARNRFHLTEKETGKRELFSIIMPTYNRPVMTRAAIRSVLDQSFQEWRLYVVDDGSEQDDMKRLAAEFAGAGEGRVWFFRRPENKGPGAARNFALSFCDGKYVAFLDSDDAWRPEHLERHYAQHERGNYSLVYSDADFAFRRWHGSGYTVASAPHPTIHYKGMFNREKLKAFNYIQTSAVTIWGDIARSQRFPEDMRIEEDWHYFGLVADEGERLGVNAWHLGETTCRYFHSTGATSEADNLIKVAMVKTQHGGAEVLTPILPQKAVPRRVSVVIPTKNRPDSLQKAIISVLVADGCEALRAAELLEIIVIDDESEAMYRASIEAICHNAGPGVHLIRNERERGAPLSRNIGVNKATGEWIQFLDDDDMLLPSWQDTLTEAIAANPFASLLSFWSVMPNNLPGPGNQEPLKTCKDVFTSQIALRRDTFLALGGFDAQFWAEERRLIEKFEQTGHIVAYPQVATVYRGARGGSGRLADKAGHTQVTRTKRSGF